MKYVYLAAGLIFLGMGGVGVILPLIPTTPFVLLAAICFGKSSEKLHGLFVSTRFYKNNIEGFIKRRTMSVAAKLKLLITITVFMGLSLLAMRIANAPIASQIILALVWAVHVMYFGFNVKTK